MILITIQTKLHQLFRETMTDSLKSTVFKCVHQQMMNSKMKLLFLLLMITGWIQQSGKCNSKSCLCLHKLQLIAPRCGYMMHGQLTGSSMGLIFCNVRVTPVGTQSTGLGLPRWASLFSYQLTLRLTVGTPTLVFASSWYSTRVRDFHAGTASPCQ